MRLWNNLKILNKNNYCIDYKIRLKEYFLSSCFKTVCNHPNRFCKSTLGRRKMGNESRNCFISCNITININIKLSYNKRIKKTTLCKHFVKD